MQVIEEACALVDGPVSADVDIDGQIIEGAGAHVATIPAPVIKGPASHPLTDKALDQFAKDWAATGQSTI